MKKTEKVRQSLANARTKDRDQTFRASQIAEAQPRSRFGGNDLYPSLEDKAAALAFSLVMNHPFADGNKRTGYGAMMRFLSRNGHTISGPLAEHESVFLQLAAGECDRETFLTWVYDRIIRK